MRIELHDGPVKPTPAMLAFVNDRLSKAVGRFGDLVQSVRVVISDINGPKGGMDTRCSLQAAVAWRGHCVVVAEDHSSDFYGAVQAASRKLKRAIGHTVDRGRDSR